MQNGQVFELPTPAHRITDSGFSLSPTLPTTTASDYKGGGMNEAAAYGWEKRGWPGPNLSEGIARIFVESKLPTPTAVDGNTVAKSELDGNDPKHRLKVAAQVLARDNLMPTPVASEGTKAPSQQTSEQKSKTGQVWLSNIAKDMEPLLPTTRTSMKNGPTSKELADGNPKNRLETVTNWGKFEAAIRRWEETLGRPAPAPTKPDGKDGAHRLSAEFTEWMMGVPAGWIVDVGLTRNEELKACGNGVVPQQAALALRVLLEGITLPSGGGA
jgi:DNA (cytosine-5)-methyltransferase 1